MQSVELTVPTDAPSQADIWLERAALAGALTRFFVGWVVIHRGGNALKRPVAAAITTVSSLWI